jgi:hypothetical protein
MRVGVVGWYLAVVVLVASSCGAQAFQHPGVLVSGAQLEFVKAQIGAKAEPFYGEYQKAVVSEYGALDYKLLGPPATGVIECGSYSRPDNGCHAEDTDASAAYVQSLLWYITGDHRYADNAIRIVNAYGHHLLAYSNSNMPLQAAWSGEVWPRSAEILKYSNAGWKAEDQEAFTKMLKTVILPYLREGSGANGNWELSMIDAMMGIAVFTDDHDLLKRAEDMWMERVPTYFYNSALDGAHPRPMPRKDKKVSWYGTTDLNASVDGISSETCRDLGHTSFSIAATMDAAETAHIQGDKLFEAEQKRLVAALEFHARLLLKKEPVPMLVCGGSVNYAEGNTFVVGYNEYHNRLGVPMPESKEWIEQHVETDAVPVDSHMMVFEPLTHGGNSRF